jgi:hypothetical protein
MLGLLKENEKYGGVIITCLTEGGLTTNKKCLMGDSISDLSQ